MLGQIREPQGTVWLREHWDELRPYNFEWVASDGERLVGHAPDLDELLDEVIRQVMSYPAGPELASRLVYAFVDFVEYGAVDSGL